MPQAAHLHLQHLLLLGKLGQWRVLHVLHRDREGCALSVLPGLQASQDDLCCRSCVVRKHFLIRCVSVHLQNLFRLQCSTPHLLLQKLH
jgi:hypothetical protein